MIARPGVTSLGRSGRAAARCSTPSGGCSSGGCIDGSVPVVAPIVNHRPDSIRLVTGNEELYERARAVIPGGVDSPVRAFGSVGGGPPFAARGGRGGGGGAAGGPGGGPLPAGGGPWFG